jgi:hypothetical protein
VLRRYQSDTNFGVISGLGTGTSLVDSRDAIRLRQQLQPMSDDAVTVARERYCATLGTIDPYMIVAKRVDAPSFYVVHRPNRNVALVTCGLWNPNEVVPSGSDSNSSGQTGSPLPGIELLAEAPEKELGDMANSWLYQCLLEVACTAKRNGTKLRRLLRERSYAIMEVMDVKLPFEFLDPTTGRACMLLGIESTTVPKYFMAPNNAYVTIVTARLLTLVQWRDSQEFAVGKKPLAARFNREGTDHISSLIVAPPSSSSMVNDPNNRSGGGLSASSLSLPSVDSAHGAKRSGGTDDNNPAKYAKNDEGNRTVSSNSGPIPAMQWTVDRLHQRLTALKDNDVRLKPRNPVPSGATVPSAVTALRQHTASAIGAIPTTNVVPATASSMGRPAIAAASAANVALPEAPARTVALEALETLGDPSDYEPPIPTGVIVNSLQPNGISQILATLTAAIRKILSSNTPTYDRLKTAAQTVYGALGTQSQLYGWQHVSEYIRNPQLYIERTKTAQRGASGTGRDAAAAAAATAAAMPAANTARGPSELHEAIDTLQETGHSVIKRLIQRIEWIISIFKRETSELTCETMLQLIGTDRRWMDDATSFMNRQKNTSASLEAMRAILICGCVCSSVCIQTAANIKWLSCSAKSVHSRARSRSLSATLFHVLICVLARRVWPVCRVQNPQRFNQFRYAPNFSPSLRSLTPLRCFCILGTSRKKVYNGRIRRSYDVKSNERHLSFAR